MKSFFAYHQSTSMISLLRIVLFILILFVAGITLDAQTELPSAKDVSSWIHNSGQGFDENSGQIAHDDGSAANEVLFKISTEGLDIYITTTGLSYIFYTAGKEDDPAHEAEESIHSILNGKCRDEIHESVQRKIKWCRSDMLLLDAHIKKENIQTWDAESGNKNFFLAHCPQGVMNVKTWHHVLIKNVYPGIDWYFHSDKEHGLKYDFIVHSGADASIIRMQHTGAGTLALSEDGRSFRLKTKFGSLNEGNVESFSAMNIRVNSSYRLTGDVLSFLIDGHSGKEDLIIDPPLTWSTYYGGSVLDGVRSIVSDGGTNIFTDGYETSLNFPGYNPGGGTYYQGTGTTFGVASILKFTTGGVRLWATYYGGTGGDAAYGLCCDANGNAYMTGWTMSSNFPTQNPGGGAYFQGTNAGGNDMFIVKFNNSGVRLWATYFGGTGGEWGWVCTSDAAGNFYLGGSSNSADLPVVNPGGSAFYDPNNTGGGIVMALAKFNSSGTLTWCTYIQGGGSLQGFYTTPANELYATGYVGNLTGFPLTNPGGGAYYQGTLNGGNDVALLKFSAAGAVIWATPIGGSGSDEGISITNDKCGHGNIYVTGYTNSSNLPLMNPGGGVFMQNSFGGGARDCFVMRLNNAYNLKWSTYLGGSGTEMTNDFNGDRISVDYGGRVYVTGNTWSSNFPIANPGAGAYFQGTFGGGSDMFISQFDSLGVMQWSTYFGGAGYEFAAGNCIDPSGSIFMCGEYSTAGAPTADPGGGAWYNTAYSGQDDIGLVKFMSAVTPLSVSVSVTNVSCYGMNDGSATLTVTGGTPPYNYSWSPGGWTTSTVTNLTAGTYTVSIGDSDPNNCSPTLTTQTVSITQPAPGNLTATPPTAGICPGDTITLSASGASTYSWNPSSSLSSSTGASVIASPTVNTTYVVTGTDVNGCQLTDTISISINPPPVVNAGPDVSICGSGNVLLGTPVNAGAAYLWSNGAATDTTTVSTSGTYWIEVSIGNCSSTDTIIVTLAPVPVVFIGNDTSVCSGNPVFLDATTPGATYQWQNNSTAATFTASSTGSYWVSVTVNGCTGSDTININSAPSPNLNVGPDINLCAGNTMVITNTWSSPAGTTYAWSTGSVNDSIMVSASGIYWVDATLGSCVVRDSVIVNVNPMPVVNIGDDTTLCTGSSITLNAATNGASYLWSNGSSSSSITTNNSGTFWVDVTVNGCTSRDSLIVTNAPMPVVAFTADQLAGCVPLCVNFTDQSSVSSGNIVSWSWLFWNTQTSTQQDPQNICLNYPGFYDAALTVVTDMGCQVTVIYNDYIQVYPLPDPGFGFSQSTYTFYDQPVTITNNANGCGNLSWNMGDGNNGAFGNGNEQYDCNGTFNYTFPDTGTYTVTQYIVSPYGCVDSTSATVEITPDPSFFLPNTFTPNGDGTNDVFLPEGILVCNFHMMIFDRWGMLLFETDDFSEGWNGMYKGSVVQIDTYVYRISYSFCDSGLEHDLIGHVNVIR